MWITKIKRILLSFIRIEDLIPLVLPDEVGGWKLSIEVFDFKGRKPYLKYRYENPNNPKEYIFNSTSIDQLLEYLKKFDLI